MPRDVIQFGGLSSSLDPSRIEQGRAQAMSNCDTDRGILRARGGYTNLGQPLGGTAGYGAGYGKFAANEVQRILITGEPTGGSFTITWNAQTTAAIAYDADSDTVYARLVGLSNIEPEDVTVSGGPFPNTPMYVVFGGQYARTDVALMTTTDSFTGGSTPASAVREEVKGGSHEEYIAVATDAVSTKAFTVDTAGAHTAITGATGLDASDWFFTQYGDRIFACNAVDGLRWKYIGTDRWDNGSAPQGAGAPPSLSRQFSSDLFPDFSTGVTLTSSGFANVPTLAGQTNGVIRVTVNGAGAETNRDVYVQVDWTTPQTWKWRDHMWWSYVEQDGDADTFIEDDSMDLESLDSSSTSTRPDYKGTFYRDPGRAAVRFFQYVDENRTERNDTDRLRFHFRITSIPASEVFTIRLFAGDNWMADTLETIDVLAGPTPGTLRYAYSYYDTTLNLETALSPSKEIAVGGGNGEFVRITPLVNSGLTGSDKIYVYRQEKSSGKWRRVGSVANSGSPTVDDHYMEHELKDLPEYSATTLPRNVRAEAITTFKQSLVVGADRQVFISAVGEPLRFSPSPDEASPTQEEEDDETRPRTVYASDNRAEEVYGVHGQDTLYIVTDRAVYAMVGDFPADLTPPRRLPGSRGAVGHRASAPYGGGILVATTDGLWFYAVGRGFSGLDNGSLVERELTNEVRTSWKNFLGDLSSLVGDDVIVFEFEDEIWCLRQTGSGTKYLMLSRENAWHEGTFAHDVEAVIPVRGNGIRWQRDDSNFDRAIRDSNGDFYTSDAGTAISWTWDSGDILSPLVQIDRLEIRATGTPFVRLDVVGAGDRNPQPPFRFDRPAGDTWMLPVRTIPGYEHTIRIGGDQADTVRLLALHTYEVDDARG